MLLNAYISNTTFPFLMIMRCFHILPSFAVIYKRRSRNSIRDSIRRIFGKSFANSTMSSDERTYLPVDISFESEDSNGKHPVYRPPESLAVSTVSPYYKWITEQDNIIRNIPRSRLTLSK